MLSKSCRVQIKAAGEADGLAEGQFRALVSVFGNKDSYGDVVMPGAFADTLAEWKASGDSIPVYWSHRMDDPDYNIGHVVEASETDAGLEVLAQLDLADDGTSSKAKQVYKLLKGRRVTQFSFAYDVDEGAWVQKENDEYYELRKLKLHEVGPTPIGVNEETDLLAVKAASEHARRFADAVKAGRVLSAKNETSLRDALSSLEGAATQIKDVLAALDASPDDDGKARTSEPAKDEAHSGKSEEPMRPSPADLSALQTIELAEMTAG